MFLEPYPESEGMKVWLEEPEIPELIDEAEDTEQRIAFLLAVHSGLRSAEILEVTPDDVVRTSAGPRVRVWDGKGGKDRESVASNELLSISETINDIRGADSDEPMIGTDHTRTLRNWIDRAGTRLADRTGDGAWTYLSPHDLRGTWATQLVNDYEVNPILVCNWGGWDDLESFLNHYHGAYSSRVQRRELGPVPWINVDSSDRQSHEPTAVGQYSGSTA